MLIDKIIKCWSGIRRIFRIFIFEYNAYSSFVNYSNLLYISIFGFINKQWYNLYHKTIYFKKFLLIET